MTKDELLEHLMRYYRADVLTLFLGQSDKYEVWTDDFSGEVRIRDNFKDQQQGTDEESLLSVAFGFRGCRNGDRAIAVWGPDFDKASESERRVWAGFQLDESDLSEAPDLRFQKWVQRYIDGSWDVEDGPIAQLDRIVRSLNAITQCTVSAPLFTSADIRSLCFPSAENNHRYHDAHSEAYKHLQDAINKDAIARLGAKLGIPVKAGDKRTVTALKQLLPETLHTEVISPLDLVSEQRRLADHKQRPAPTSFPAFDQFNKDIAAVARGLESLRTYLAKRLDVDIGSCEARASELVQLPKLDETRPPQANYSICNAGKITGKRVVGVRAGYRQPIAGQAETEVLILEFDDGSVLGIDPVSNVGQLTREGSSITTEALHITLFVTFVPPLYATPACGELIGQGREGRE